MRIIRIAISLACLALLPSCATTSQTSPTARPAQKDGSRAGTATPTWESSSHIEIGGSI
jgi:hypothetical protein